jgi:hypothetical protein
MGRVKAEDRTVGTGRGRGHVVAALLLIAAMPLARPNIYGERYATLAAGTICVAALVSLAQDRMRLNLGARAWRPLRSTVLWLLLAHLWVIFQAYGADLERSSLQSIVSTVLPVAAAAVVLADERRRLIAAKLFAAAVLAVSLSCAVTLVLWAVMGVGSGVITQTPVGAREAAQPLYFPFTVCLGQVGAGGLTIPRLTGFAREPGWMAMYAAFTFFLLPRLGWGKWRAVALFGLLATASTAGFGVFAVVLTFELFLRRREVSSLLADYVRRLVGLAFLAGAVWLAVYAPVFGLEAKGARDQYSVNDRLAATSAGWTALQSSPLGGNATQVVGGVNLIAAIASVGLPFVLCVLAALLLPRLSHRAPHLTSAPIAVLVLTLATSQPPQDSTWVFVCALMAYAVTQPLDRGAHGIAPRGAVAEPRLGQRRVVVGATNASKGGGRP